MVHFLCRQRLVAAALIGLAAPAFSDAAVLGFRNDTNVSLLVQVISLVNNVPRRSTLRLAPGQSYQEQATPGIKQIIIVDAKQPTLPLFNGTLPSPMNDQFFVIQVDAAPPQPGKANRPRQPLRQVKLVPADAPAKPPATATPAPRRPPGR